MNCSKAVPRKYHQYSSQSGWGQELNWATPEFSSFKLSVSKSGPRGPVWKDAKHAGKWPSRTVAWHLCFYVDFFCAFEHYPVATHIPFEPQLSHRWPQVLLQNILIKMSIHFSTDESKRPSPWVSKARPCHDASSTMLQSWDQVVLLCHFPLHALLCMFFSNNSTLVSTVYRMVCQSCCGADKCSLANLKHCTQQAMFQYKRHF